MTKHPFLAFSFLAAVTGCGSIDPNLEQLVASDVRERKETVAANMGKAMAKSPAAPFVGSKIVNRKSEGETLPDGFTQTITFGNGNPLSLTKIGQGITTLTNIPVNISPDLIPVASPPVMGTGGMMGSPVSMAPVSPASTPNAGNSLPLMSIAFTGSLSELLDRVASRMGIAWEYRNGSINFSRYVTRVYKVNMYPGSSTQTASVGKTGSASTGSSSDNSGSTGGSFSSSSASAFSSALDPWSTVENAIKALTTGGAGSKYAISPATGLVVVTDTKDAQNRISAYLKDLDAIMNRQITLKVAVISADAGSRNQAGIDWNMVWNRLATIAPNYSLSFRGVPNPAVLAQNGGGLGLAILSPTGGRAGKWDGSAAMFRAINSVTNATMVTDNVWHALNKQPLSVSLADQTGFASTAMQQNTVAGGNPVTSTTVTMLTTGFILNMVPSATDGNEIALQFSLDISTPPIIDTFGTVQVPRFSSKSIGQRAKLREGETLILSGFSLRDRSFNKSGLFSPDDPILAGGNRDGNKRDQDLVILITPIME